MNQFWKLKEYEKEKLTKEGKVPRDGSRGKGSGRQSTMDRGKGLEMTGNGESGLLDDGERKMKRRKVTEQKEELPVFLWGWGWGSCWWWLVLMKPPTRRKIRSSSQSVFQIFLKINPQPIHPKNQFLFVGWVGFDRSERFFRCPYLP